MIFTVLGVIFFLLKFPTDAANAVTSGVDSGNGILDSLAAFFRALSS